MKNYQVLFTIALVILAMFLIFHFFIKWLF
jgi:hypothetical protein